MPAAGRRAATVPDAYARDLPAPGGPRGVRVGLPGTPPPSAGYPLLVVLDGGDTFGIACATARAQARRPSLTRVAPAVIVGIDEGGGGERRIRDCTPAVPRERLAPRPNGMPWPETGGAEDFLDWIAGSLLPAIAHDHPIDSGRVTLFGHSLGGLLGLHAALTRPDLFEAVVASSPSIWFGGRAVRAALSPSPATTPRILITVGGEEGTTGMTEDPAYAAWVRDNRMVENAQVFAQDLAALGWPVTFQPFAGENHASVLPAALSRAIRFALPA